MKTRNIPHNGGENTGLQESQKPPTVEELQDESQEEKNTQKSSTEPFPLKPIPSYKHIEESSLDSAKSIPQSTKTPNTRVSKSSESDNSTRISPYPFSTPGFSAFRSVSNSGVIQYNPSSNSTIPSTITQSITPNSTISFVDACVSGSDVTKSIPTSLISTMPTKSMSSSPPEPTSVLMTQSALSKEMHQPPPKARQSITGELHKLPTTMSSESKMSLDRIPITHEPIFTKGLLSQQTPTDTSTSTTEFATKKSASLKMSYKDAPSEHLFKPFESTLERESAKIQSNQIRRDNSLKQSVNLLEDASDQKLNPLILTKEEKQLPFLENSEITSVKPHISLSKECALLSINAMQRKSMEQKSYRPIINERVLTDNTSTNKSLNANKMPENLFDNSKISSDLQRQSDMSDGETMHRPLENPETSSEHMLQSNEKQQKPLSDTAHSSGQRVVNHDHELFMSFINRMHTQQNMPPELMQLMTREYLTMAKEQEHISSKISKASIVATSGSSTEQFPTNCLSTIAKTDSKPPITSITEEPLPRMSHTESTSGKPVPPMISEQNISLIPSQSQAHVDQWYQTTVTSGVDKPISTPKTAEHYTFDYARPLMSTIPLGPTIHPFTIEYSPPSLLQMTQEPSIQQITPTVIPRRPPEVFQYMPSYIQPPSMLLAHGQFWIPNQLPLENNTLMIVPDINNQIPISAAPTLTDVGASMTKSVLPTHQEQCVQTTQSLKPPSSIAPTQESSMSSLSSVPQAQATNSIPQFSKLPGEPTINPQSQQHSQPTQSVARISSEPSVTSTSQIPLMQSMPHLTARLLEPPAAARKPQSEHSVLSLVNKSEPHVKTLRPIPPAPVMSHMADTLSKPRMTVYQEARLPLMSTMISGPPLAQLPVVLSGPNKAPEEHMTYMTPYPEPRMQQQAQATGIQPVATSYIQSGLNPPVTQPLVLQGTQLVQLNPQMATMSSESLYTPQYTVMMPPELLMQQPVIQPTFTSNIHSESSILQKQLVQTVNPNRSESSVNPVQSMPSIPPASSASSVLWHTIQDRQPENTDSSKLLSNNLSMSTVQTITKPIDSHQNQGVHQITMMLSGLHVPAISSEQSSVQNSFTPPVLHIDEIDVQGENKSVNNLSLSEMLQYKEGYEGKAASNIMSISKTNEMQNRFYNTGIDVTHNVDGQSMPIQTKETKPELKRLLVENIDRRNSDSSENKDIFFPHDKAVQRIEIQSNIIIKPALLDPTNKDLQPSAEGNVIKENQLRGPNPAVSNQKQAQFTVDSLSCGIYTNNDLTKLVDQNKVSDGSCSEPKKQFIFIQNKGANKNIYFNIQKHNPRIILPTTTIDPNYMSIQKQKHLKRHREDSDTKSKVVALKRLPQHNYDDDDFENLITQNQISVVKEKLQGTLQDKKLSLENNKFIVPTQPETTIVSQPNIVYLSNVNFMKIKNNSITRTDLNNDDKTTAENKNNRAHDYESVTEINKPRHIQNFTFSNNTHQLNANIISNNATNQNLKVDLKQSQSVADMVIRDKSYTDSLVNLNIDHNVKLETQGSVEQNKSKDTIYVIHKNPMQLRPQRKVMISKTMPDTNEVSTLDLYEKRKRMRKAKYQKNRDGRDAQRAETNERTHRNLANGVSNIITPENIKAEIYEEFCSFKRRSEDGSVVKESDYEEDELKEYEGIIDSFGKSNQKTKQEEFLSNLMLVNRSSCKEKLNERDVNLCPGDLASDHFHTTSSFSYNRDADMNDNEVFYLRKRTFLRALNLKRVTAEEKEDYEYTWQEILKERKRRDGFQNFDHAFKRPRNDIEQPNETVEINPNNQLQILTEIKNSVNENNNLIKRKLDQPTSNEGDSIQVLAEKNITELGRLSMMADRSVKHFSGQNTGLRDLNPGFDSENIQREVPKPDPATGPSPYYLELNIPTIPKTMSLFPAIDPCSVVTTQATSMDEPQNSAAGVNEMNDVARKKDVSTQSENPLWPGLEETVMMYRDYEIASRKELLELNRRITALRVEGAHISRWASRDSDRKQALLAEKQNLAAEEAAVKKAIQRLFDAVDAVRNYF